MDREYPTSPTSVYTTSVRPAPGKTDIVKIDPKSSDPKIDLPANSSATKIMGGGQDAVYTDVGEAGTLLVGLEIGLGKFGKNDVVRAFRPDDKDTVGTQGGTDTSRVIKVIAKPDSAIGDVTIKAGLTVDGMSVTFMKLTNGKLDPKDSYESEWVGGKGGGPPMKLAGDGTPVIGVTGKANPKDATGLGLILKQK